MIGKEVLNYRIVAFIGKGGMGSVYLAEHKFISVQKAAIKVINADMVNDYTRERLKEEAEHLAELNHQNIVTFHDYHIDEEGTIYLIMEYADGKNLDDYIRTETGLIVQEKICPLFEPILDAVGYAHAHNILHRDIKPSNIVITKDHEPRILDFGIATLIHEKKGKKGDRTAVGTPSYMSPEQVKGEDLDERSDIYSLGVLLHTMLTGRPPYDVSTLTSKQINEKVLNEPLPRLRSYYRHVSERVQKVVDKATAKQPEDRYQSCAEFKKALHTAIYPPKKSKTLWIILGMILLIGAGFGTYMYIKMSRIWDYNRVKVAYFKDYVEKFGIPVGIGPVSEDVAHHREFTYRFEYSQDKVRRVSLVNARGHLSTHSESEWNNRPSDMQIFYVDNGKVDFIKVKDQTGKVLYRKDYNDNLTMVTFQYDDQYTTEMTLGNMDPMQPGISVSSEEKSAISRHLLTYDIHGYVTKLEFAGLYNGKVGDKNGIYGYAFKRDDKGRAIEIVYLGLNGEPSGIRGARNLTKRVYTYDQNDNWVGVQYLNKDGKPAANGQGVMAQHNTYDGYGNKIKEQYTDLEGKPVYRTDGHIGGVQYKIENGQIVLQTYLGTDGQPCTNDQGYASIQAEYDANGYCCRATYLDLNGQKYEDLSGTASIQFINDARGLPLEQWDYDADGNLVENAEGVAGSIHQYDLVGNETQVMFYTQNRTIYHEGLSGLRYVYDDKNRLIKQINLDEDGEPTEDESSVSIYCITYNQHGNITQMAYHDEDDCLVENNDHIAGYNNLYDEKGNMYRQTYFDENGKPALYRKQIAAIEQRFNELNQRTAFLYKDKENNLVLNQEEGCAGYEWEYDDNNNITMQSKIGEDGRLIPGTQRTAYEYDENNVLQSVSYRDEYMRAAYCEDEYHKQTLEYDDWGRVIAYRYYNRFDQLKLNSHEYAIERLVYNEKGLVSKKAYFKNEEDLCLCDDGYAVRISEFDRFGRPIKEQYFDTNLQPTDPDIMVPVAICEYDQYGHINFIATQDVNGNYIHHPSLYFAIRRSVNDKAGRELEYAYYDEKDRPMEILGIHKGRFFYSEYGECTGWEKYDVDNQLVDYKYY